MQQKLRDSQEPLGHPSVAPRNWVRAASEHSKGSFLCRPARGLTQVGRIGFCSQVQDKGAPRKGMGTVRGYGRSAHGDTHRTRRGILDQDFWFWPPRPRSVPEPSVSWFP